MFAWLDLYYTSWGLLAILVALFIKCSLKFSSRSHYWKERNVPSAAPIPLLGNYLNLLLGKTFFQLDLERYKRLGRVFGVYEGTAPVIFVGEPELVQDVMVKDFHHFADRRQVAFGMPIVKDMITALCGEEWKRVRSVMTPAFSTGKLKKMIPLINECAEAISKNFLEAADSGLSVDVKRLFGTYSIDVIASTVFGSKLENASDPNNEFIREVLKFGATGNQFRFFFINLMPKVAQLLGIKPMDGGGIQFFAEVTKAVIAKRRKDNIYRDDMIQMMLEAQNRGEQAQFSLGTELDSDAGEEFAQTYFQQYLKSKTITEEEFVANCVLFFTGGYDSSSTTMGMVTYYLALHPEYQDRVLEEVDRIWKKYPEINYEAATETKYLDAIIAETLRLFTPGARIERRCVKDYELRNTGIKITNGMLVGIPAYCMHMDPEFFPEPERFDPERFLGENKASVHPYSYLPFGLGPRHCIGMRLVQVLMKMGLLNIFRKVSFKRCKDTDVPIKIVPGAFNMQPQRIPLQVVRRQL